MTNAEITARIMVLCKERATFAQRAIELEQALHDINTVLALYALRDVPHRVSLILADALGVTDHE